MSAGETMTSSPAGAQNYAQGGRLLRIDTPLGRDRLLLVALEGEEQISRPFNFTATMLSADHDIRPESLIGSNVTAWVTRGDGQPGPLNGFVRRLSAGPVGPRGLREYRADIVPWLWFLTCTSDCRIFQDLTVPDLLKKVFKDFGLTDYNAGGLSGSYPKLDYCVQYRETAFDFVSRWMEEAGIYYFFEHQAGKHTMVLADRNLQFQPVPERPIIFAGKDTDDASPHLTHWQHSYDFRSGRYAQNDFHFETPSTSLLTRQGTVLNIPRASSFERYDYPGRYTKTDYGNELTRTRIEEEEAQYHTVEGNSGYASFHAGCRFTLARHDIRSEEGGTYVLSRVVHSARETAYFSGSSEPSYYRNSFVAVPADVRYRSPRVTPRPVVRGPQTAMVVGPSGETIHTDKHGRVKLQFHWDREGKRDDHSSCWMRVSQAWAGGGWGGVNIPHVGHEVVVSFLEGDPDRPLVTGRVYNAENMKAMGLPANKTQSAMRDHSGNEILLEGKGAAQDIRITAVKDQNVTVVHDYNEIVKTGNRKIEVQTGTHTETIKGDTTIHVSTGNFVHGVDTGTATYFVTGNVVQNFKDHYTSNVFSDIIFNSVYSKIFHNAALAIQSTTGASQVTLDKSGLITIIGKNIRIVGSETVQISGERVAITGGSQTSIGVGSQNTTYSKDKVATSGASINSAAVGEHVVAGAVVKIN